MSAVSREAKALCMKLNKEGQDGGAVYWEG